MKLYKFKDYSDYVRTQKKANKKKRRHVWAGEKEIIAIVDYIKSHIPNASFGICHGVRTGWEVKKFRNLLGIEVIGTEIGEISHSYVIRWDFNKVKPEWIGMVDFIYSNSFDHTYAPDKCLKQWMKCLNINGLCFLEWAEAHDSKFDACDCFAASMDEYRKMIEKEYDIMDEILIMCYGYSWKDEARKEHPRTIFVIKNRKNE